MSAFDLSTRTSSPIETGPNHFNVGNADGNILVLNQIGAYGTEEDMNVYVHHLTDPADQMTLLAANATNAVVSGNRVAYADLATNHVFVYDLLSQQSSEISDTPWGQYIGIGGDTVVWQDARPPAGFDSYYIYGAIVPEPSAIVLLATGMLGLAHGWWRKRPAA